jgi:hypothetical protein
MAKLGRNDPCPCGSGKKYKQCCLNSEESRNTNAHSEAIAKAVDWLLKKHKAAVHDAIDSVFFGALDDNDHDFLQGLGDEVIENIMGNAFEWLLADGNIFIKDEQCRVAELLLGNNGPQFSEVERQRIELLSTVPLRLYDIVELMPGESLMLRDVLLPESPPVQVQSESCSKSLTQHDFLGTRILPIGDHFELSGAAYAFPRIRSLELLENLQVGLKGREPESSFAKEIASVVIPYRWLQLFLNPFELPPQAEQLICESTLFVTDLYRVQVWGTLEKVLAAEANTEGSRELGWTYLLEKADSPRQISFSIYQSSRSDRIKVFYQTPEYADEGRPWFEELVGTSVVFLCREITDLGDVLAHFHSDEAKEASDSTTLSSEQLIELVHSGIQEMYVDWADKPLPILNDKTPREAIQTLEGLEMVKYLLHSYELIDREPDDPKHHVPQFFGFLWESLGIAP